MQRSISSLSWAALLVGGGLLGACSGNDSASHTTTPSSTLGTDSAATKVGGTAPDSTGMSGLTGAAPAGGVGGTSTGGPTGQTK